ncbi:Protein qua-1 [Trichinella pseudospiralis]
MCSGKLHLSYFANDCRWMLLCKILSKVWINKGASYIWHECALFGYFWCGVFVCDLADAVRKSNQSTIFQGNVGKRHDTTNTNGFGNEAEGGLMQNNFSDIFDQTEIMGKGFKPNNDNGGEKMESKAKVTYDSLRMKNRQEFINQQKAAIQMENTVTKVFNENSFAVLLPFIGNDCFFLYIKHDFEKSQFPVQNDFSMRNGERS